MQARGPKGWRTPALAGASAVAHLAVLAALALRAAGPVAPQMSTPQVIVVEIEPRPLIRDERPRAPPEPEPRAETPPPPATALTAPTTIAPSPPRPRDEDEEDRAAPRPAPAPSAAPGVSEPWRVTGEGSPAAGWPSPGALPSALPGRLNCRLRDRLTPEEQARCDQAFGQAAGRAAPITGTGDPARDARMARDAAQALARHEAQRAPLASGVGVVGPADCVGSNFGTGCAGAHLGGVPGVDMNQGATTNIRQRSNKVD